MWLHVPNRPPEVAAGRLTGLSLCAGTGTLDEGISDALAGRYQAVGYVERESYAASALVARMEESSLDHAPVWDDIRSFDGRPWRGKVDIVSAGLPCQPYSVAGKRKGHADRRNLWDDFFRIIGEVQPALAFIENSPELVSRGWFEPIGERLCAMGFSIDAEIVGSKEVSAPHLRRRAFILAVADSRSKGLEERQRIGCDDGKECQAAERTSGGLAHADGSGSARQFGWSGSHRVTQSSFGLANSHMSEGRPYIEPCGSTGQGHDGKGKTSGRIGDSCEVLADSNISGRKRQGIPIQRRGSQQASSMPSWRFGIFPPPDDQSDPEWRRIAAEAPWLWPNMGAEPLVRSVDHGHAAAMVASRTDRIRCVGNGVVPLSAALAFAILARRLGLGRLVEVGRE